MFCAEGCVVVFFLKASMALSRDSGNQSERLLVVDALGSAGSILYHIYIISTSLSDDVMA